MIWILLVFIACWVIIIYKVMGGVYDYHIKVHKELPQNIREKYKPFVRNDLHRVTRTRLILGSIFLLPWRFISTVLLMIISAIYLKIQYYPHDPKEPYPLRIRNRIILFNYYIQRIGLFFMGGITSIETIKLKI